MYCKLERPEGFDIREYKNQLRSRYKQFRQDLTEDEKAGLDGRILERLLKSKLYTESKEVFTYVSTAIEVDTRALITKALSDGKRVAVPKCLEERMMRFYYIESFEDLEPGTFSVLEPIESRCGAAEPGAQGTLCIVPGLSFDMRGYRLGYGKGYYDRYLKGHPSLLKVGLCYCGCTTEELYQGSFDIPVSHLITEKYIKSIGVNQSAAEDGSRSKQWNKKR